LCYCHHCGYKLYVPDDAEERLKQQRRDMHRKPARWCAAKGCASSSSTP
jgi:hypothetical protein